MPPRASNLRPVPPLAAIAFRMIMATIWAVFRRNRAHLRTYSSRQCACGQTRAIFPPRRDYTTQGHATHISGLTSTSDDPSITAAILARALAAPSRNAVITSRGTFTWETLATAVTDIALTLREEYSTVPTPIAIVMAGDPLTVAALLACDLVSRPAVLLHPLSTRARIRAALQDSRAGLLLQLDQSSVDYGWKQPATEIRHGLSWTDLAARWGLRDRLNTRVVDGFVAHQTSGSMGQPKLALRTRHAVRIEADMVSRALFMSDTDVVVCASAVSHSYGCIGGLLVPLMAGASINLPRNVAEARTMIEDSKPSIVFGLGPMYEQLANSGLDLRRSFHAVRLAFSAGAPLAPGLFERLQADAGIHIRQDYGTTETGTIALDLDIEPRSDVVGRPLPHVTVRLVPPADTPLASHEAGEVVVQSPALAQGYFVNGEVQAFDEPDAWYRTQDAGSWFGDQLRIHRRLRPFVWIEGDAVSPDCVEHLIKAMPGVLNVAVAPRISAGKTRLAAVVATMDHSSDEVEAWCRDHLPQNWIPESVVCLERLPRTPAGKIVYPYS